jgi:hypothetical protein
MRLKAGIWVDAYLRRCSGEGLAVYVARRGDADAGAILIKVDYLNGETMVYAPAIGGPDIDYGDRHWRRLTGLEPVDDERAEQAIGRQVSFDPDIWVIVVEDRTGTALLDKSMITEL